VAERRDFSILVNLGFLAALIAVSSLMAATPPETAAETSVDDNVLQAPQEEIVPADAVQPSAPVMSGMVVRLSALTLPPVIDTPAPDTTETDTTETDTTETDTEQTDVQPADAPFASRPPTAAPPQVAALSSPEILTPAVPQSANQNEAAKPLAPLAPPAPHAAEVAAPVLKPLAPSAAAAKPVTLASAAVTAAPAPDVQTVKAPQLVPMQARVPERPVMDRPLMEKPVLEKPVKEKPGPASALAAAALTPAPLNAPAPVPSTATETAAPAEAVPRAADWQVAGRLLDDAARQLTLEFLWPADPSSHSRIYGHLTGCLGVETGVIDAARNVHLGAGGGRSFNAALHSPFMRLVERPVDPREQRLVQGIRRNRLAGAGGTAVRVFRRSDDMRLLAALNRAFGGLPANGHVSAEYRMEGNSLYLGDLTLDGRRYEGRIRIGRGGCA